MRRRLFTAISLFLAAWPEVMAVQRFPKPEFETGYITPDTVLPWPRTELLAWLDVAVLFVTLSLASWLLLKKRSRIGVFLVSVFSLLYFGFYREGCICSVGSVQNISLALSDQGYLVPVTVLLFFLLPLIFTLLFGRTFCAAVCPLGAVQDLVSFKPLRMGPWLNAFLGMIPHLYLGLAVLLAATATDFVICRYDPFVGIFRLNATFGMFLFGGILLLSGVFIARPYCRFLCPYGVILNWMSRFSWKHMTITPSNCIQCRLCENSCPYDAIDIPNMSGNPSGIKKQRFSLKIISLLIPLLVLTGVMLGYLVHGPLARLNRDIRLWELVNSEKPAAGQVESPEITAFKSSGITPGRLQERVIIVTAQFRTGSMIYGGFIGLVFGFTLAGLLRTPYHSDYLPNRGRCFSCGRCMDYCPVKPNEEK